MAEVPPAWPLFSPLMTDDVENPYQSPKVVEPDERLVYEVEVRRGRRIFLAITAGSACVQGLILWLEISGVTVVQASLALGLFFAMWIGQQWAIAIGALCFVLAALSAIVAGLAFGTLASFTICLVIAILFAGTFWLFVTNESLNAFFRYQYAIFHGHYEEPETSDAQTQPDVDGIL